MQAQKRGAQIVLMSVLALTGLGLSSLVWAAQPPAARQLLTFDQWKERQVLAAENRVVRLANRLHLLRSGLDRRLGGPAGGPGRKAEISKLTRQVSVAEQNLKFSKELTLQHYIEVYLRVYREDPAALERAASQLQPEQVTELLKSAIDQNSLTDRPAQSL